MKGFSPGEVQILWLNGGVTMSVLDLWGQNAGPVNSARDLANAEREARGSLLVSALGSAAFMTAGIILTLFAAADEEMRLRFAAITFIVAGGAVALLSVWSVSLMGKILRSNRFERAAGEFGYEYAALIAALRDIRREWADPTWTAAKVAQSNAEALKVRAEEVLHNRAASLEAAEAAQRAEPDSPACTLNVESERAAFKEGFRVFVRFKLADKEAGWTPFFPKGQTSIAAA